MESVTLLLNHKADMNKYCGNSCIFLAITHSAKTQDVNQLLLS